MNKSIKLKLQEIQAQADIQNHEANLRRARSVTVGTAFGGTTELMMRGNSGDVLWCVMQPVEVVELIHQLAGNIGCHLAIKPRNDFSSWRDWRISEAEKKHLNGHPPFVNDMAVFQQLGASGFNQEQVEAMIEKRLLHKEYDYVGGDSTNPGGAVIKNTNDPEVAVTKKNENVENRKKSKKKIENTKEQE